MNKDEIVSYDLSLSHNLEQVKRMIEKAFEKFSVANVLVLHSEQG